ncbi:hypothetical protein SAMN05192545_2109 [Maribacter dokdonensis]|uniref:Uncharacterized protein n=1 Tax=Maribacter dokdonensis TaxID=320912 RepID=A0A1H4PVU8_9FLAO|nr:hypothetical protein I600_1055 [Maribacter dokdonensis DSW-8]CAG2534035.1 hypothetical protein MAR621_03924 [Maribacter dokdonensis]SDS80885.1 hypothetical protein SAMN05192545_2109 [Maribacter dokdonensis]SEC11496.1 hypothetical protein SAMN05192540_2394 [Maribacter dokdonensis]
MFINKLNYITLIFALNELKLTQLNSKTIKIFYLRSHGITRNETSGIVFDTSFT